MRGWAEGPRGWSGGALREAIVARVTGARRTLRLRTAFGPCHAGVGVRGVKEEPRLSRVGARAPRRARDRGALPARAGPSPMPPFPLKPRGIVFPISVYAPLCPGSRGTDQSDSILDRASQSGAIPKPLPSPIAVAKTVVLHVRKRRARGRVSEATRKRRRVAAKTASPSSLRAADRPDPRS